MPDRSPELLSAEEVERWANTWADELLDPKSILRAQVLVGLQQKDMMRAMAAQIRIPGLKGQFRPKLVEPLRKLILSRDRERILRICRKMLSSIPRSSFEFVRNLLDRRSLRKFLLAEANKLKSKKGRPAKATLNRYADLVARAESLFPVLLHLLREIQRGTRHTVTEILDFLAADFEKPVAYLRRHIRILEETLNNPKFLKNAKRLETRARRLAAGLAGCDDGYKFSTSVERVGQGKRARKF
jgi:hypothetical protein